MTDPVTLTGMKQAIPSPDPTTGLIECAWIEPLHADHPGVRADPTDWMSGFYYVKLTGSSGEQQYIQFVVRDDRRPSDILMAEAITTAQAYNVWGGKSLYGRSQTAATGRRREESLVQPAVLRRRDVRRRQLLRPQRLQGLRVGHGPLPRGQRLRRDLRDQPRRRPRRQPAMTPQNVHLGRPRRVLVMDDARQRGAGSRHGRQPRLLLGQHVVLAGALRDSAVAPAPQRG